MAKAKVNYEAALDELKILMKKKQELESKELLGVFINNDKSLDEILAYMSGVSENETYRRARELISQGVHNLCP